MDTRPLLVLDLDETLVLTQDKDKTTVHREPDFMFEKYNVFKRPHLEWFLRTMAEHYQLAVWSAGAEDYVPYVLERIVPSDIKLVFVRTRKHCLKRSDPETMTESWIKDLKEVKPLGFSLNRTLIVEDKPENCVRNYGNAIYVRAFDGQEQDDELFRLGQYLPSLANAANVRTIEKRKWRSAQAA